MSNFRRPVAPVQQKAPPKGTLSPITAAAVNAASLIGNAMGTASPVGSMKENLGMHAVPGPVSKTPKTLIDINKNTISTLNNKGVPGTVRQLNKQGEAMTDKQLFKVAFLSKCIDEGLTLDEIKVRVKQALYFAEKRAGIEDLVKWPVVAGLGTLALAGGLPYFLGNKVVGPAAHTILKPQVPDKDDLLREELINEYDRQSEIIKRQAELTKRKRLRDRGISGVTRF